MGYVICGLLLCLLAVILLRAAVFQPKPSAKRTPEDISFDKEAAVDALAQLVRCKTVSRNDPALEEDAEFRKLVDLLPALYPNVFSVCTFRELPDRALLLRWSGKSNAAPSVMMAHYDVVPADAEKWEKPPFAGIIENGVLWGRGTLDTKATLNGILSAADHLIETGFVPENDIYFAFSGGEEVNGKGAGNIVDYFAANNIRPALVLDEGGAVVENVFPGVKIPCGLIGIAEKGMLNLCFTAVSNGGHASAPPPNTPVTTLARACHRIAGRPFKMHITPPARQLFDTLGRRSTFGYKVLFANLWLFAPVLDLICRIRGGELNALVRTTAAFTQMEGSSARNVLPTEAKLVCNMRLNPADTVASAVAHMQKAVRDPRVQISVLEGWEPSPISEIDCESWNKVVAAVTETWHGCVAAPYLMVQCADARHYRDLSSRVYRFSAMDLSAEERKTIHGNNERIRLETITKAVEFFIRLMKLC